MELDESAVLSPEQEANDIAKEEDAAVTLTEEENLLIDNYLNGKDIWNTNEEAPNPYYLGDVIEAIIHIAFPAYTRPPLPPGPHYFPLKLCFLGPLFSGRHTQIKFLEAKYGIKSFDIEKIIEDRNGVLERKAELDAGKKLKKPEEESDFFVQESINCPGNSPDELARLFRAKIRGLFGDEPKIEEEVKKPGKKEEVKCQGWVALGYPRNKEEAKSFEKIFSGYVHPTELPESIGSIKKREAEIIAKSSLTEIRPYLLEKSGFDLIFWLEAPLSNLVHRAIDRRVDNSGNVYNLTYNPPPDNLLPKLKLIEHPNEAEITEKYHEFIKETNGLKDWFRLFGIEDWKSLNVISGHRIEEVKEMIEAKIQEWLKIREEISKNQLLDQTEVKKKISFRDTEIDLNYSQASSLYEQWENALKNYILSLKENLVKTSTTQNVIDSIIEHSFVEFKKFLTRPDHKQSMIEPFVNKIINLMERRSIITSKDRKFIFEEIDDFSDKLWDIIEERKAEAINYRLKIMKGISEKELSQGTMEITKALIQTELEKLVNLTNLIIDFQYQANLSERNKVGVPELNFEFSEDSDIYNDLDQMCEEYKLSISQLGLESLELQELSAIFALRVSEIKNWAKEELLKMKKKVQHAYDILDDWITDSVTGENNLVNLMVKHWKSCLEDRRKIEITEIEKNDSIIKYLRPL
ncbi:unnamed protein product [Blepharisma stoltei]|uniref:Adenylate kinase n=1 Tax=Blepharisma stoltei TaxID=1481888 RepID=A0AAU9IB08_9CILI|nr:unnamed protein product [Blepharisma stoltei]